MQGWCHVTHSSCNHVMHADEAHAAMCLQHEDGLPNLDAVIARDIASDVCLADTLELQRLQSELKELKTYLQT